MTKPGPILAIQYLRALAALAVVSAHAEGLLIGQAGVDVFFVISGFIMWVAISRSSGVVAFAKHRLIRVVPLYWIATLIMGLHQGVAYTAIVKSMLFIPFVGPTGDIWPVLVQGWTLNYEMFFYLLITMVLFVPKAMRLVTIVTVMVLLCLCGKLIGSQNPMVETYTNTLSLEFCFGIAIAELWFRPYLLNPALILPLAIASLALVISYGPDALPTWNRVLVWGIPSALLVAASLSLEASGFVARINLLLILGEASYAIYLFHTFLVNTVVRLVNNPIPGANIVAVVTASAITGVVITRCVDRPILRYLRNQTKLALTG